MSDRVSQLVYLVQYSQSQRGDAQITNTLESAFVGGCEKSEIEPKEKYEKRGELEWMLKALFFA